MSAMTPIQCPIIVGRDPILDLADDVFGDALDGRGRTILLAGEAGIGKTRLVRAIARKAVAAGFSHQQGDLSPLDADVPLAVFGDLLRSMREEAHLRPLADQLLARTAEATIEGTYSRKLVLELVDRLQPLLDRPTLMVFEDLQWADDLSLEAISELARMTDRLQLVILGTFRQDETPPGTPFRDWRARILTQRHATEVRLERLTLEQTGMMTSLLLATGRPAPRSLVDAVHERSDGLPLHVEELIADARARGTVDVETILRPDVPDTIEDAVLARAGRRSPDAQAVAEAGAVIGRCFAPRVLAQVLDRPEVDLEAGLRELVDHGFLFGFGMVDEGYYDFRHQLLRDTLYRNIPEPTRRRYHARAGEFGGTLLGASQVHASLHFEQAGLRREAFEAARAGAEDAVRLSAHREAFELYRRAHRNIPDDLADLERANLLERYSDEAGAIEENDLAEELAWAARDAYLAAGRPVDAIATVGMVHTYWRRAGRPLHERRRLIEQAELALGSLPPSRDRDAAAVWLMFDRLVIQGDAMDVEGVGATIASIRAAAVGTPDESSLLVVVGVREAIHDVLAGDPDGGLAAIARLGSEARDNGLEAAGVTAFREGSVFAVRALDYRAAESHLAEGLSYADSIQQSQCAHVMGAVRAEVDWAAGRWDDAVTHGEQAMADRGCRRAPAMAAWALGYVAFGRGEYERAKGLLNDVRRFADDSEMIEWRLPSMWGLAEAAHLDGDPAGAIERCETALGLCTATGERALLVPWIVTGVRAYQAVGRPNDAERWLARCAAHLASTPAFGRPALDHGAGLVALASGATNTARVSLESAVAGWTAAGRGWECWWARLDLAACHARSSRFAAAVAIAAEVHEAAVALGSPSLLARAEEILRQARGRVIADEPWRPLTTREFEVARLIAAGRTNAEIADELGIAPKTASSHVEHILAKLGASRRTEIAAWVMSVDRTGARTQH